MTRDDVIAKIKKLLALSGANPNANEAVAAALKAQKLMADYDIAEIELGEQLEEEITEVRSSDYFGKRWRGVFAAVIAKNFRCRVYRNNHYDFSTRKQVHANVFMGHKLDAEAAKLTYESLVPIAEKLASQACHEARSTYGTAQGVKNTFLLGFVDGVREELEKQCEALMLVVPQDVEEAFNNLQLHSSRSWRVTASVNATEQGRTAGRDAVRSRRMDSAEERLLAASV